MGMVVAVVVETGVVTLVVADTAMTRIAAILLPLLLLFTEVAGADDRIPYPLG
jgi:hypothetical protein